MTRNLTFAIDDPLDKARVLAAVKRTGVHKIARGGGVMRTGLGALAILAALPVATTSNAQDSFDMFRTLCLETDGKPDRIQPLLSGDWTEMRADRLEELRALTETVTPWARITRMPSSIYVVIAGRTLQSDSEFESTVCDVLDIGGQGRSDIPGRVSAWVGAPSQGARDGTEAWNYEMEHGRPVVPNNASRFTASYSIIYQPQPGVVRYEVIRTAPVR
ncbi:MAG: hypothetical protein DCF29_23705 [Alphaproteobacteria bacterium]|uniref:hypothetical protein n=1 Tax=Brevundimonas sp. TaxID=1871086 RepID=UPI000DB386CC|nr:hypothetical protein [Brevundimonas sp.]MBJ7317716.1 hypothetical protein [Brevundimonas sp.]PZN96201.1 MAG: hypothetical protein DCF29_23705 [Alphaproteobacteria bacterium]